VTLTKTFPDVWSVSGPGSVTRRSVVWENGPDSGRHTEFSEPIVSRVMDGVQRYIANADDRPADEIEQADPALAALAAQQLSTGTTTDVYIYTTDTLAGEGAETVLASEGYGDSVTFVNGFRFIENLVAGDS
jgi:hypothetical protein